MRIAHATLGGLSVAERVSTYGFRVRTWGKPKDRVEIEGTGKITVDQFRALAGLTNHDGDTDDDEPLPPPEPKKPRARVRAVSAKKKRLVRQGC